MSPTVWKLPKFMPGRRATRILPQSMPPIGKRWPARAIRPVRTTRRTSPMSHIAGEGRINSIRQCYIDNYWLKHSCFEQEACVVRAGAVPYKAVQMLRALRGRPVCRQGPAEETVDAVEESRRRPLGLGSERAMGLGTATGWATTARP